MQEVILTVKAFFTMIAVLLAGVFGFSTPLPESTEDAVLVSQKIYPMLDALVMGQGIATDGEYLYTSGAISAFKDGYLGKIDLATGKTVQKNLAALPDEFSDNDYDHIGGIGYYDGIIYAAVEDHAEEAPMVLLYDAETLEYTGTCYHLPADNLNDGIPWCTVDGENGLLYCSQFDDADRILAFNMDDMTFSHAVMLTETLQRVQDGVYYNGKLYANCDPKGEGTQKTVYEIDLQTGETHLMFARNTGDGEWEAEGIAVLEQEDGSVQFLCADYDKAVGVYLRTYTLTD